MKYKIIVFTLLIIVFSMAVTFVGCGNLSQGGTPNETPADNSSPSTNEAALNLAEFTTIIYPSKADKELLEALNSFKNSMSEIVSLDLVKDTAKRTPAEGEKEILIGNTRRQDSADILDQLADTESLHGYAISFSEKQIVINGTDTLSVMAGMKYFLTAYVNEATALLLAYPGDSYIHHFDDEIRIFPNLVQWELQEVSTIEQPPEDAWDATMKYASVIELQHQSDPAKNGILVATGERWIGDLRCPVYRSLDKGTTWEHVTALSDPFHGDIHNAFAPCVFELPVQVGEMPAGTVIIGSNSINDTWDAGYIVLYRSYDQGETWEGFTVVAESVEENGEFGVWEPNFVCTDDGTLICYYSDDSDSVCSQKLVYKSTTDGINWSDQVDTVALTKNRNLRPGMPVVTKMGDGRYIMVYEIVGMKGNPLYYKVTDDPLDWGDANEKGEVLRSTDKKQLAATPGVAWSPLGGENGMLVVTGWRMAKGSSTTGSDIFVSFDYGETWQSIPNYYSYNWENDSDTWGYSASIFFSSDGETMYYMANPQGDREGTTWFTLFKIKVS